MNFDNKTFGLGITGSYCTFSKIISFIQILAQTNAKIIPVYSYNVSTTDNRFMSANDFKTSVYNITKIPAIETIVDAEPIGPKKLLDVMIIAPCTGNTLAKLANGITDTPVLMAAKAHLRNNRPLVIAISSNDALGINLKNIGSLLNSKNIYFVPFYQDDPIGKPNSLIADTNYIIPTIAESLNQRQIHPLLLTK